MTGRWSFMSPMYPGGNLVLIQERFLVGKELSWLGHASSLGPSSAIPAADR